MFPWALRYLSGPHQKIFQYHKAVRSFIHHEITRHKLRTPEAPKDFITCYLSQITKVGLELSFLSYEPFLMFASFCKLLGTLKLGPRKGLSRPELVSLQMVGWKEESIDAGGTTP